MSRKSATDKNGGASAVELVMQHNAGREPERLAMKYSIMHASAFAFLRGTSHLFHKRMIDAGIAPEGPAAWSSGDLHLENYGTYLGDNGLAYFDLNDFDAAMLAPAPWDMVRLVTSLLISPPTLTLKRGELNDLAHLAFEVWQETLREGKSRWIERRTAEGLIGDLMQSLRRRDQVTFLDSRSKTKKGIRSLKTDGIKMLPLPEKDKHHLGKWLHGLANGKEERTFFNLIDAARRIAGVASMGAPRFALLIEGTGSPDGNVLLDLKSAEPGAAMPYTPCVQPDWASEAHRIVEIQQRCQAVPMAFLRAVEFGGKPFILRQLQPAEDRLDLTIASSHSAAFSDSLHSMAELSAWAQLRASGRQGAANADALIAFGATRGLTKQLTETARRMEAFVMEDWHAFRTAYDKGELKTA